MSLSVPVLHGIVDKIAFYVNQQQLAKYLAVGSITLLAYDWITNIDLEVTFIWRQSWSWGRVIYHANRIWSLILLGTTLTVILFLPQPTPSVQANWLSVFLRSNVPVCYRIGDATLAMLGALRQKASGLVSLDGGVLQTVYVCPRRRMLCAGLLGVVVSGTIIANVIISSSIFLENQFPGIFSGCFVIVPNYIWVLYMMPLVYESTLFVLTLWRIYTLSKDVGATPLMQTLAQNGTAYFATLVILVISACIGGTIETVKIAANGSGLFIAVPSVVCSRMIFSLYQITDEEIPEGPTMSETLSNPGSSIIPQFAIPLRSSTSDQHTV